MNPDLQTALAIVGILFCLLFGFLTAAVVAQSGIDVLTVASFVVIALVLVGLVASLRGPPPGD